MNKWFRNTFRIIIFIICISIVSDYSYGNELDKLIIAGDNNYPPYEFIDNKGNYSGFNVDIIHAISIELGIEIELSPMEWNEAIEALKNGEVDVLQGMTQSFEREENFDFSTPLITNSQQIFVRKDNVTIVNLEDLNNLVVAFQEGDVAYEWINSNVSFSPKFYKDQNQAMLALVNNEVDAFVGNRLTGIYNLQRSGHVEEIKIVGESFGDKVYAAAVVKGNIRDLKLINKGLNTIRSNGTYDKIYKKWFGESFIDNSGYWKNIVYYSFLGILLLTVIALGIAYVNRKLKREVEKRTEEVIIQKKVIEESNRLRGQILEGIDNGIVAFNIENHIISMNAAAKILLDIEHSTETDYHDLIIKMGMKGLSRALNGEIVKGECVWEKNGKTLYLDYRYLPIRNAQEGTGAVLVLYDATLERKLQQMVDKKRENYEYHLLD